MLEDREEDEIIDGILMATMLRLGSFKMVLKEKEIEEALDKYEFESAVEETKSGQRVVFQIVKKEK